MNIWNFICSTFQTPGPISRPLCLINGTHLHWADVILITFEPRAVITSAAPNPEHHRVQPVTRFPMIHWLQRPVIRRTKYHLCSVLNQQNTAIDWSPQIANTVWSPLGNKDVFVRALISLSCLQCSEGTLVAVGPIVSPLQMVNGELTFLPMCEKQFVCEMLYKCTVNCISKRSSVSP